MMRAVAVVLSLHFISALQYKSSSAKLQAEIDSEISEADDNPDCNGCKYAYVTMWIEKEELPGQMLQKKMFNKPKVNLKVSAGDATISEGAASEAEAASSGEGTYVDGTERELGLSDQMESDAMDYEESLATFTNHLSGKDAIWELASNLQFVGSKYPLVVLTNDKNGIIKDQEDLKEKYPNIEIVELQNYLWPKCTMRAPTIPHFQKLNVLGMDHFNKLMWMDADIRLRKNIDYMFEYSTDDTTWFMKDDWYCGEGVVGGQPRETADEDGLTNGGYSTGLMLFKPNRNLLEHTLAVSSKMGDCWGDQTIIQHAFGQALTNPDGEKKKMSMKWIPGKTVRYPQCDKSHENDHADALHFVKVKKGFVTPKAKMMESDEDAAKTDM